jgi:hypothetical protein
MIGQNTATIHHGPDRPTMKSYNLHASIKQISGVAIMIIPLATAEVVESKIPSLRPLPCSGECRRLGVAYK